jgi:hypothetical protein
MNDIPVLVKFYIGAVEDGVGPDGLPMFREQLKIIKSRGPLLRLDLEATDDDISNFPLPYEVFLKEEKARKTTAAEGYPLSMWPACGASDLKILAARDIVTVEQLARIGGRTADPNMPGEIRELADRAIKMIELQKSVGKFEKILRDKDGQISVLQEQLDEALKTINAQKAAITTLKTAV